MTRGAASRRAGRLRWSRRSLLSLAAVLWATGTVAAAAEAPAGAAACSGCHAPGAADGPVPGLAGRPAAAIVADMRAFQSGAREATVMNRIAKGFSDEEIRAIAEWLAAGGDAAARPARP